MTHLQVVVFRLADELYGLMAQDVKEISRLKELVINKVPVVPKHIVGLVNLRGEVVPVADLRMLLGLSSKGCAKQERVIIVQLNQHLFGLQVDEVMGVKTFLEEELHLAPEAFMQNERYISALARQDNLVVFVLGLEYLFENSLYNG